MLDCSLSDQELARLRMAHGRALNVRDAYHINAVILLARGRTPADVVDALLIDADTVRAYLKRYRQDGLEQLLCMSYVGSESLLYAAHSATDPGRVV
ncbi:MAG: helix-turn-helix domain-containing protein [Thiohalocapsa sp.]